MNLPFQLILLAPPVAIPESFGNTCKDVCRAPSTALDKYNSAQAHGEPSHLFLFF